MVVRGSRGEGAVNIEVVLGGWTSSKGSTVSRMLLLLLPLLCHARFENDVNKENMEKGQSKYREFSENSRKETGGECWRSAVKVHRGCKES